MRVISVCNIKGGVGKTTTIYHLAHVMDSLGHKVLLIDNDSQASLSKSFNFNEETENTLYDVYINRCDFSKCTHEITENIHIVPNILKSKEIESRLMTRANKESILKNKKNTIKDDYDFVLIDNTPFAGAMLKNSLGMSDYYMPVTDISEYGLTGIFTLESAIEELKEDYVIDDIKNIGILRNMLDKNTQASKDILDYSNTQFNGIVFDTVVYRSTKYNQCIINRSDITKYSPKSAEVYVSLLNEIKQRI